MAAPLPPTGTPATPPSISAPSLPQPLPQPAAQPSTSPKQLKILMLHGYTQSGPLFRAKTAALAKALSRAFPLAPHPNHLPLYPGGVHLVYPTAPHALVPGDAPGAALLASDDTSPSDAYGWWTRNDASGRYDGIEAGLAWIADILRNEGPFAGVIGFSQGACAAGLVASLLEEGRREAFAHAEAEGGVPFPDCFLTDTNGREGDRVVHPPLLFAAAYSGFVAADERYNAAYEPGIRTPMLHVVGSVDTVVSEERSLKLVGACAEESRAQVVRHPGGHFVPCQKQWVGCLVGWVGQVLRGEDEAEKGEGGKEKRGKM